MRPMSSAPTTSCRRRCGRLKRVVSISTSEVYGTPRGDSITEDDPLNAQSPYAASKIAADQLALSYHRSFGLPVGVLRPFNTFGPRQSARAVIPTILAQGLAGLPLSLGSLHPVRDFLFVEDTVAGILPSPSGRAQPGQVVHSAPGRRIDRRRRETGRQGPRTRARGQARRAAGPAGRERGQLLIATPRSRGPSSAGPPRSTSRPGLAQTAEWIEPQPASAIAPTSTRCERDGGRGGCVGPAAVRATGRRPASGRGHRRGRDGRARGRLALEGPGGRAVRARVAEDAARRTRSPATSWDGRSSAGARCNGGWARATRW